MTAHEQRIFDARGTRIRWALRQAENISRASGDDSPDMAAALSEIVDFDNELVLKVWAGTGWAT